MEIKLHPVYAEAQERMASLKAQLASLYTELSTVRNADAPEMEAIYMERIGRFELVAYEIYMQVQFLKRRRQLMLRYLNHGEEPDEAGIRAALGRLYDVLAVRQKELQAQLKRAKITLEAGMLSETDSQELKSLYKDLVRQLHPDLHPDQTPVEATWFMDAVNAYKLGDLVALRHLHELAALGATPDAVNPLTPIEDLVSRNADLQHMVAKLQADIEIALNAYPLNLRDLLSDEEAVRDRVLAIQRETKALTTKRDEVLAELAEMGWTPDE
jgi:hypothetical protein